ncbi:ATP-binding protein [Halopiger xanaduensis]|uniref:histidine kinase n=1 Tax=Halopiger xanaduensis (strain DSM 18323 / JCM 14033 / SH-6) TaxID=797210 RepID=F8D7W4_HALXS|nr:ATP-binding protein [Halopiger xanaduensis]AEH36695.1 PAS/PAC sensor signal transduction histidine kinase [Halopiger xanaduensis SH-6]
MGVPGPAPDVTLEDVRRVVAESEHPGAPVAAGEVAERLGCSTRAARTKLSELIERNELRTKRIDGTRVWWRPATQPVDERGDRSERTTRDESPEPNETDRQPNADRSLAERILETVPIGIGVVAADGTVVRGNERLFDRLPCPNGDCESDGVDAWTLYDADGEPIPNDERPWARVFDAGEPVTDYECQVEFADGERRWRSITAAPIAGDDGDEFVLLSIDDVADRKERERQLRREYDQTEKLLETAPIAIAVQNADRETIRANQRAQEAFGLSEQEFRDNPVDTGEWRIYDEDGELLDSSETTSGRVLATGEPVLDEELVFEPPNGERLYFRVNSAPIFGPDGEIERIVTAAKDVTELKARERQLEQRKAELETELSEILGRVSDAFYALDEEWRYTHLNEQAAAILDRSREELLGRPVWETIPDAVESFFREQYQRAMETQEPVSFEIEAATFDAWLEFAVYPSESGLSVYFRDITERKRYEQQLEASNERLEQFAYAASHDLQEPLRMVTSYLQLLENRYGDELDDDAEEFIEFAVDGAERMREMIDGLLEYSRVETQGDPFEPVDLNAVLADVREDLRVRIEESDADIAVEDLPTVEGDASQLRQVFQNLLTNAVQYSGDGPPQVRVSAERAGDMWDVSVRDEGVGIDPDDQDRIFEVFQRLHGREEHPGTGIGLSLCRRIVERHGGDIRVDSEPGEGTTFSFTLPAVGTAADGD